MSAEPVSMKIYGPVPEGTQLMNSIKEYLFKKRIEAVCAVHGGARICSHQRCNHPTMGCKHQDCWNYNAEKYPPKPSQSTPKSLRSSPTLMRLPEVIEISDDETDDVVIISDDDEEYVPIRICSRCNRTIHGKDKLCLCVTRRPEPTKRARRLRRSEFEQLVSQAQAWYPDR